jgi:dethiobiotin synthetase
VNHTSLAVSEIRRRSLLLLGIILVNTQASATPDQSSNASLIADLTGVTPLGVFPYVESGTPALLAAALESSVDLRPIFDLTI